MPNSLSEIIVESDEPLSIVEIADGRYRLIQQAPRRVAKALPPGLYVTRVKYDDRVEERLVEHGANPTQVSFGLDRAEWTTSRRQRESAVLTRQMSAVRSTGLRTWITVSIKAPGLGELPDSGGPQLPDWSSFTVYALDGRSMSLAPLAPPDEAANVDHDRILSHNLPVGWYTVRIPSRDGAAAFLPLYVSPRFSPTILLEIGGVRDSEAWFDFDRLVVSYDEMEGDAYQDSLRQAALRAARRSLELGRNGLTDELMDVLYKQKFRDPMLGLLALQMLLLNAKSGLADGAKPVEQFNTVMDNIAGAFDLPQHPDLVLARAQAKRLKWPVRWMKGDDEPLVAPPLLRANWNALVTMSARRNELVGPNRPLRLVSEGLLQTGIWVMWKPPARTTVQKGATYYKEGGFGEQAPALKSEDTTNVQSTELFAYRAAPPREYASVALPRAPRPSRAIDAQLEVVVDQVRATQRLRDALQERLQSDPPTSTVLERAVSRAVLQLADVQTTSERNVPAGFARRLANNLAVPFSLVGETVGRMRTELRAWRPDVDPASDLERSFLP